MSTIKFMETNEGQIITIIKAQEYPLFSDVRIPREKRLMEKIVYQVHLVKIDPKPIKYQLELQIPTSTDRDIADYLGLRDYSVYFWPDEEVQGIGHRIILVNENTAYIYYKV